MAVLCERASLRFASVKAVGASEENGVLKGTMEVDKNTSFA